MDYNCSKCGGEKDSEGWCRNYCMDDEPGDTQDNIVTNLGYPIDPAERFIGHQSRMNEEDE